MIETLSIGTVYSLLKDVVAWFRRKKTVCLIEPFCVTKPDLKPLFEAERIKKDDSGLFRWIRPGSLMAKTESPNPTHEVVYIVDKKKRTKRMIGISLPSGELDLILVKRKQN